MTGNFKKMFARAKPLIGVIHLPGLPGSPAYGGSMEAIIAHAMADAAAYVNGGADGIIIENFGDYPFVPGRNEPQVVAAMTAALARLRGKWPKTPFGVNVLRNDAVSALAIAQAGGGRFIRVNIHTGATLTDQGIIEGRADETLRFRRRIGADDVMIFADIDVKHGAQLVHRDLKLVAKETVLRGMADALILTGGETGDPPDLADVRQVRSAVECAIVAGSGVNKDNVWEVLPLVDGVIVGTSLKRERKTENPVDEGKVRELAKAIRAAAGKK
jgi:hypothetical protein